MQPDRSQMILWRMRVSGSIPQATNTHPKHVIIIVHSLQELLNEHGSIKRHKYTSCIVFTTLIDTAVIIHLMVQAGQHWGCGSTSAR